MKSTKIVYSLATISLLFTSLEATSLKNAVENTMKNNQDIVSKSLNNEAFKKYIDEQKSGYYPKLDLTAYLQKKKTDEDYVNNRFDKDETLNGGNVQLDFEQLIYDGNLTPKRVEEAKASYKANKYKNSYATEEIISNVVNSYLNILKYEERIEASQENLKIHNNYFTISKETEQINGEILDKVQTKAKIHNAKTKLFDEQNSKRSAYSSYERHTGKKLTSKACRPIINESVIPSDLNSLYKMTLKNNYKVLEQIENIKAQKAVLSQEKAAFLPTLKFKLQGIYDKDLIKQDDLETTIYSGKLELKYNLFNGLADRKRSQREELFLKEAQVKLDVVSKEVIDDVTVAYNTYNTSKKQIIELKEFIEDNKQIIEIYNDQFDAGTRNFIDVLNVEADLYNSKISLINSEYTMYQAYYEILKNTSMLQESILNSNDSCSSENLSDELTQLVKDEEPKIKQEVDADANLDLSIDSNEVKEGIVQNDVALLTPKATSSKRYALFLNSYSKRQTAQNVLNSLKNKIEDDMILKIEKNRFGSYTVAVSNIDGKQKAIYMKNKLNSNFPQSYFRAKK